jgi:hypothetical protein
MQLTSNIVQKLGTQFGSKYLNVYLKKLTLSVLGQIFRIEFKSIDENFRSQIIKEFLAIINLQLKNQD